MKKILVIEDEKAYLKLLKSELIEQGFTVIEATNGKTGLAQAKKERPDLVLLDIRMPVMDGMTMLDLLRKEKTGKKIKVIILTNMEPDDKIIGQALHDYPSYYFVKSDIHLNHLIEKIKELIGE